MKYCLLYIFAATLLVSCSKESKTSGGETPTSTVRFVADIPVKEDDWGLKTRGVVADNVSIGTFGAFCFHTFKKWNEVSSSAVPNKMFDVEVLRTPSTNDWVYNPPVEWLEGNGNIFTFFGYSPHAKGVYHDVDNLNGNNIEVVSTASTPGVPTVRYSTLDYVPLQVDLLFAKPIVDIRPVEKVQMQFSHALSQIRFKAWSRRSFVSVKSIEVSNVKYKATFAVDGSALTPEADVKTFLLENVNRTLSTDEQNPTELSDGGNAFILLPQDLTSNATAQIVVTYEVGGKIETSTPYTIVQNWEANRSYTYLLTLGGPPTADMVVSGVTMTDWIVDSQEDMATTPLMHNPKEPTADQIVEINGLMWAKGNLVAKNAINAKVGAPEDGGLYFQFGSLIGWKGGANGDGVGRAAKVTNTFYVGSSFNAADEVAVYPSSFSKIGDIGKMWPSQAGNNLYYFVHQASPYETSGTNIHDFAGFSSGALASSGVGDPCRYYLGGAWRMPTSDEFKAMNDAAAKTHPGSWVAGVSVDSYLVLTFAGGTELKFPAVGSRIPVYRGVSNVGKTGDYWSSSVSDSDNGREFFFSNAGVGAQGAGYRRNGFPVRCVSPPPPPAGSYIPTSVLKAAGWPADKLPARGLQVAMRGDKQLPGSGTTGTDPRKEWKTELSATVGVEIVADFADALFGMGKANTDAMIAAGAALHPAAQYCRDMGPEWYLPSLKELKLIYDNRSVLGADYSFTTSVYWSSTDYSSSNNTAWGFNFRSGEMNSGSYKTNSEYVRCVREI